MSRKKMLRINVITSVVLQIITLVSGFIIPRLYLGIYGSSVNGLVTSVKQFLGFISLLEMGMGAIVQGALYKPLEMKNKYAISEIRYYANKFFKRVAIILVIYVGILSVVYPIMQQGFEFLFVVSIIVVVSISSFVQYYFGIVNQLLLYADQRVYIPNVLSIIVTVLNTIFTLILVSANVKLPVVLLVTSLCYIIRPMCMNIYVNKKYGLIQKYNHDKDPLEQKRSGLVHHISFFILMQTDIAVITVFMNLISVSIYSVYSMVITGVKGIIISMLDGIQSLLGNYYAKEDLKGLAEQFSYFEWVIHNISVIAFASCIALIVPFVDVYTQDIIDAIYVDEILGMLFSIMGLLFVLRQIYFMPVKIFSVYKNTEISAYIEAFLNIVLSVILINYLGLYGVVIGTIVALSIKIIYMAFYIKKLFGYRIFDFFKLTILDAFSMFVVCFFGKGMNWEINDYFSWFTFAIVIFLLSCLVVVGVNLIFCKKNCKRLIYGMLKKHYKK